MKPAKASARAAWAELDIGFKVYNAGLGVAIREARREKRMLLASRRALPYDECLKRLLARD